MNQNNNNCLALFNKIFFIKQIIKYVITLKAFNNIETLFYIIDNLLLFLFDEFIYQFNLKIENSNNKQICYNEKNLIFWIKYIQNLLNYSKMHYYYLFNFKYFQYLLNSFIIISNISWFKDIIIFLSDDTFLFIMRAMTLGLWGVCTSWIIKKSYYKIKNNNNFFYNNYKFNKKKIDIDFYLWWKLYYKYNLNYTQYKKVKNFFLLNKKLNNKYIIVYNNTINEYCIELNDFYNLLMNNPQQVEFVKETREFSKINYQKVLFSYFLKLNLESPFLDADLPFTFFFFHDGLKKAKLNELSKYLSFVHYFDNLKESNISRLTKSQLNSLILEIENNNFFYKLFNKSREKNYIDALTASLNEPMANRRDLLLAFKHTKEYKELLQLTTNKDFCNYNKFEFLYLLKEIFDTIINTENSISINTDIDVSQRKYIDYNLMVNNFSLLVSLNESVLNNKSFQNFMKQLKSRFKDKDLSIYLQNLDLFEENYLNRDNLFNLFLKENAFFLDYFSIIINQNQYTLCYLLFMYKTLRNVHNYEVYHKSYYKKFENDYNIINYKYHKSIHNTYNKLSKAVDYFIKYKNDIILQKTNNDFYYNNGPFLKNFKLTKKFDFSLLDKRNYDVIKINKKLNAYYFVYYFEKYKYSNIISSNFQKKKIKDDGRLLTFDEFANKHTDTNSLLYDINMIKQEIQEISKHYILNKNGNIDYNNINFFIYDIDGFRHLREDESMFLSYRDYLTFFVNDPNIFEKQEFQLNYGILYFNYAIKLLKNFRHYEQLNNFDHLIFQDNSFFYKNWDDNLHSKRQDFLHCLEHFLKNFKTLNLNKNLNWIGSINFLIVHATRFQDYMKVTNFNEIYNDNFINMMTEEDLLKWIYEMEFKLDDIIQIWNNLLDHIDFIRKFHNKAITWLKEDLIEELLNYPMFKGNNGFLSYVKEFYIILREYFLGDRIFEFLNVITMCLFRVFEKHYKYHRLQVMLKKGFMPKINYILVDELEQLIEYEKKDPLIFIKLYNSKQKQLKSTLWHSKLRFFDMLETLCNYTEKDTEYDVLDSEWIAAFKKFNCYNRDVIIYDLNYEHIQEVYGFISEYNKAGYDQLDEQELELFLEFNSLQLNNDIEMFEKVGQGKRPPVNKKKVEYIKENFDYDFLIIKNPDLKEVYNKTIDKHNSLNKIYEKKGLLWNDIKEAVDYDYYSFTIFNTILDNKLLKPVKINYEFFLYLESILETFGKTHFKDYLVDLYDTIKYNYSQGNKTVESKDSINYLYYLIMFYDRIIKLYNNDICNTINTKMFSSSIFYSSKILNINYINTLFTNLNKKQWDKKLFINFSIKNLFTMEEAPELLYKIFNILNNDNIVSQIDYKKNFYVDKELNYLPKLNNYIFNNNFNCNLKYNFYDVPFFSTFYCLLNSLNIHILKINYMLNSLKILNNLINNIYLNLCYTNINNVRIIQQLYNLLIKEQGNKQYIELINILLYIKDPIYLYNILTEDLKNYIKFVLQIYDIMAKPDYNKNKYELIKKLLVLNNNHIYLEHPLIGSLDYDWKFADGKKIQDLKIWAIFSTEKIQLLDYCISNLDNYKGYFNLDFFNGNSFTNVDYLNTFNDISNSNILTMFNIDKLLLNFNELFTINNLSNKNLFKFYSSKEFLLLYDEKNEDITNSQNLLHSMLIQSYRYDILNIDYSNLHIKKPKIEIEFKQSKDTDDLYHKEKKIIKRKSVSEPLITLKKKTKKIKKKNSKNELLEDNDIWTIINSDSEEIEVTDSEDTRDIIDNNVNANDNVVDQALIEKKADLITFLLSEFRQWASDIEYNEAYQHCRQTISDVLLDFNHPIWDDYRSHFPNELYFLRYISKLNEEQRETIFDNYWQLTIEEIKKKREEKKDKHNSSRWASLLKNITIKKQMNTDIEGSVLNLKFISEILNKNLKENKAWHKKWHEDLYFLNKPHKSDRNWKTIQAWNTIYEEGHDIKYDDVIEYNDGQYKKYKKPKNEKLWEKINWWKQW